MIHVLVTTPQTIRALLMGMAVLCLLPACEDGGAEATGQSEDDIGAEVTPEDVSGEGVSDVSWDAAMPEDGGVEDVGVEDVSEPEIDPAPADEIAFIYNQEVLRTFELVLSEENLAILDADPAAENYVPGTLIYDGVAYDNVGIRYKGSAGAWIGCVEGSTPQNLWNFTGAKTCDKLSLKVSFNKYDPEGRFFGVKKLLFHAMNSDPSLMRERLGYGIYRQMGVAAPRAVHARVIINGTLAGLYANVEYIDGRFTRSRFEDGKGNLYKEVWPTTNPLSYPLTQDRLLAALRTNEDEDPSVQRVLDFSAAMEGATDERRETLESWMSVPYLASFIAADRGIGADDGAFHYYCSQVGCGNHNFYIYEEENDERLWIIPWDLDNAFVVLNDTYMEPADQFLKVLTDWYDLSVPCEAHPGSMPWAPWQMPPVCDPVFKTTAEHFRDAYDDAVGVLLAGPMSEEVVEAQLESWTAQILDTVVEVNDLQPSQLSPSGWYAGLNDLKGRISALRVQAAGSVQSP